MTGRRLWRGLWYGLWMTAGIGAAWITLIPAQVRGLRLTAISGAGPYVVGLSWSYGTGARPSSIIFDLVAGQARGSVTTDGEAFEAEIPLGMLPHGPYSLTISATYRLLGFAHTVTSSTGGVV